MVKKRYILEGKLLTPLITSSPVMKKGPVRIKVLRALNDMQRYPLRSHPGKLVKGERREPTVLKGFRGYVRITCYDYNETRAREIIKAYLLKDYLGRGTCEGFGKVQWLTYREEEGKTQLHVKKRKLRIRKGLGLSYPLALQRLLCALMLHDFVQTSKHFSKIYVEVAIHDPEIRVACQRHHEQPAEENSLLSQVKYYDKMAAYISRRKTKKVAQRYDYKNGKIDFEKLAKEIEEKQQSAYKLYHYIYHSKELKRIVESMSYGRKSLRNHLLLMVNLAIGDFLKGKLVLTDGRKKISTTAKQRVEKHSAAKDAEMHLFPEHEQC